MVNKVYLDNFRGVFDLDFSTWKKDEGDERLETVDLIQSNREKLPTSEAVEINSDDISFKDAVRQ
jgi:hypothetical protein